MTTLVDPWWRLTEEQLTIPRIWSVSCKGELFAGIVGGHQFQFGLFGSDLYVEDGHPALLRRDIPNELKPVSFFVLVLNVRSWLGIDEPRCPDSDLTPVVKFGARPPGKNGCGSGGLIWNYQPFVECCSDHDYCFGVYYTYFGQPSPHWLKPHRC